MASHQYHRGALRVLRPHYLDESGQVCYVVVNPGGAYLGADLYLIEVEVGDGAELLLTTQSATKIYRTPGSFAEQRMRLRLGEGARLELAPDQLIAYREASYRQNTHITVRPSSSLIMAEVVTPGWSPDGEPFRYEELRLRTEIRVESGGGSRAAGPRQRADPPAPGDVTGMAFMEGFSHVGSLMVVDPRVDQALADELHALTRPTTRIQGFPHCRPAGNGRAGAALALQQHGGTQPRCLVTATALLRKRWYGQEPLNLRKY